MIYSEIECPLIRKHLQTALGNGLNNVTFEKNNIGSGSRKLRAAR